MGITHKTENQVKNTLLRNITTKAQLQQVSTLVPTHVNTLSNVRSVIIPDELTKLSAYEWAVGYSVTTTVLYFHIKN